MLPDPFQTVPAHACRNLHLAKGGAAFRQGDRTKGLFIILVGKMELRRFTEAGDIIVIHRAVAGETFAEPSLFSKAYHCDAVALQQTELVELDRGYILRSFRSDPDFAFALTRRFATQLQDYRRKLELLAIRSAEARVHAAVADGLLRADIKAFAADIGLSHEAVYRALAKLAHQGRLKKVARGRYEITRAMR